MFRLASPRLWVILRKEFAVVWNNPGMVLKPAVTLTILLMLVVYLVDSDNDRCDLVLSMRAALSTAVTCNRATRPRWSSRSLRTYCSSAKRSHRAGRDGRRIIIPSDFAAERGAGRPAQVQVISDATSPSNGSTVGAYVSGLSTITTVR